MPKNKHHFVPRFYLSAFQSAPQRINILRLGASIGVRDASLKDQCYQHKFYGSTDDIEDALGVMGRRSSNGSQRCPWRPGFTRTRQR
jgi:hypothetical protein